ncbi:3-hexulose-6-phosphate synthase [Chryseomicrobium palamuruense]|uniref:3-hexulose-6-phosphate synthase n=1 Tax=Chryseomicrobium palamuruense TaxID=682973 RepID=A0ABV8UU17_9BACL
MKLQLALDRMTRDECLSLIQETYEFVDIVEMGTGVIKEYGMAIIREVHSQFPGKTLLADMKTCDAGKHEAKQAFEAGAEIVTAMAFSADRTIEEMLEVAQEYQGIILIDLLGIHDVVRVKELYALGVRHFCLHKGKDMQSTNHLAKAEDFELVQGLAECTIYIAGGITQETVHHFKDTPIDILIVGSGITGAKIPAQAAQHLKQEMQNIN